MSIPFRDVLPLVEAALAPFVTADRELTVLRDVSGRVRVVVKGIGSKVPETLVSEIGSALHSAIDDWLGENTPVWRVPLDKVTRPDGTKDFQPRPSVKVILDELERSPKDPATGLRLVERHVSKDAWTGRAPYDPPWSREDVTDGGLPPIITYFSQKGGVGRTTAVVATALLAAQAGKKVALIDLDLEAPGLGALMGEDLVPNEGVLDLVIAPTLESGAMDQARYLMADPTLIGEQGGEISVLTAGKLDDGYLEMLARMDRDTGANREAVKTRLVELFTLIHKEWNPDLILVDARAGLHDLGGLMLASLSHAAVMVLTANPQSRYGMERVSRLLSAPNRHAGDPVVPLVLVHGMAPDQIGDAATLERDRVRLDAYNTLKECYYPQDPGPLAKDPADLPHDLIPLPWQGPLRGRGGKLDSEMVAMLCREPYKRLYERVIALYPR